MLDCAAMGFTLLDTGIVVIYLVATVAFAVWLGRRNTSLSNYFLADRRLPWWLISLSIVATETSTLTFIGAPALSYMGDLTFLQLVVGYFLGRVLVSLVLMPAYFKGEVQTAYELLRFHFGCQVRNASAAVFQVTRVLSDGVRLFATGLVLSVVAEIPDVWCVALIGAVTIIYTVYGGMVAVVWNDALQLLLYLGGAVLALGTLLAKIPGGWSGAVTAAAAADKLRFWDLSMSWDNPYTLWAGLFGGAFLTFATHGTDQIMVQRYLACGQRKGSQWALIASGIFIFLQFLLFLLIGVLLYAFYQDSPHPQQWDQPDRIFPTFIVQELPAGISGLLVAAIFAAAMSTLSSSLNSLTSSFVNDFYRNYLVQEGGEAHYLSAARWITITWGAVLISVSILARHWGSVLEAGLSITSITMGPVLGIFLLGLGKSRAREMPALLGMAAGLLVVVAVSYSGQLAWTWYVALGTSVTYIVGRTAA